MLAPIASTFGAAGGDLVALVKPQFEAGRGGRERRRRSRPEVHRAVLARGRRGRGRVGLGAGRLIASPILGPEGNREFLLHLGSRRRAPRLAAIEAHRRDGARDARRSAERVRVALGSRTTRPATPRSSSASGRRLGRMPASITGPRRPATRGPLAELPHRPAHRPRRRRHVPARGPGRRGVDVPLLGINLGKVGFLSKAEAEELESRPRAARAGASRSRRMALEARSCRGGRQGGERVHRPQRRRRSPAAPRPLVRLDVAIEAGPTWRRSSPTASSSQAHRLDRLLLLCRRTDPRPGARNLIVTPIAGYLSAIRSVVVGPDQMVRCRVVDAHEALVSIDGREDVPIEVGDVVEVRASSGRSGSSSREGALPFWDLVRHKVQLLPS